MPSWKPTTLVPWLAALAGACAGLAWLALRPPTVSTTAEPQVSQAVELQVSRRDPHEADLLAACPASTTAEPQVSQKADPLADSEPLLLHTGGSLMAAGIRADLSFSRSTLDNDGFELQQPVLRLWSATTGDDTPISLLTDTPLLEHTGSPRFTNRTLVQIVELDVENSSPEVLFSQHSGGAHCCAMVTIFRENDHGKWQAIDVGAFDGDNFAATEPVPGNGYLLARRDNRFLYRFAGYAGSFPPARFLALQGDRIVDVSDRPHLRPLFAERARYRAQLLSQRLANIGDRGIGNGFLAGYAATHARAGCIEEAWPVVLQHYDRDSEWGLEYCPNEHDDRSCGEETMRHPNFPSALAAFLREAGYISEDLVLPTSLEPKF